MNTTVIEDRKTDGRGGVNVLRLCLTALFAALISSGAFITIPLPVSPVPVSIQNLFALLSGLVLGPFYGAGAVLLYLIAGALGAPVFAGAASGFVHFFAPSGGYLWGYVLCAAISGLIAGTPKAGTPFLKSLPLIIIASVAGMAAVYVPGILWLKRAGNGSWAQTFAWGLFPFIAGDLIKIVFAALIAPRLRKTALRITQ